MTKERLLEMFEHDARRGVLIWKAKPNRKIIIGTIAGSLNKTTGYIQVRIDGVVYSLHRLIWLYVHGTWPRDEIDHIDLNKTNNRIENLREATSSNNKCNQTVRSDSMSRVRGIYEDKRRIARRFRPHVAINGKRHWLGSFASKEEAAAVRRASVVKYHGDFARE